jgi:ketosteroid isomerase-like protein
MESYTTNEKIVADFLRMVAQRKSSGELNNFYHPDVRQIEYPNAIVKNTIERNLAELKAGAERGLSILAREEYEIVKLYSFGDIVVLEAIWKGTLSVPIGTLAAGDIMTAHFAQFFEFRDGKIYRQRNYDCFDPF